MAKTPQKWTPTTMSTSPNLDHLQQVQELNRAFLAFLQTRLREQQDCLGLPAIARTALRLADPKLLDAVAAFPQALFRLQLVPSAGSVLRDAARFASDTALHDMCSAILWSARYASRHSVYQARLLFGLSAADIQRLRALPVADLQRFAWAPGILQCAFGDKEWLWQWLLRATQPESRQQLTLLALQPGIERDWPLRRPAVPVL
jgi:hypothetical protein